MMSDFTPRAQQVLVLARKEAERFKHNYVGTEHLLLGLIKALNHPYVGTEHILLGLLREGEGSRLG
jgi:Clp amino terminal domain, pathogenicity island component